MREKQSLISAVIPVYNGERYLAEAIESVLAQTYHPVEVIVVDDGSTDRSAEIARSFSPRVDYFYQPNQGLGATRNLGAAKSRGEFLSFLDADDIWLPDKLSRQMAAFYIDPALDMIFGHVEQFVSPELVGSTKIILDDDRKIMPGYVAAAILIKRKSFFRVGPFSTNWRVGEFIDWYLKAQETGLKISMLPEVVLKRRLHTGNMGIRERDSRADYVRILKASLDRRRKRSPR